MKVQAEYPIVNAYDSCQYPAFDLLGLNNPCPSFEDGLALVGRAGEITAIWDEIIPIYEE